MARFKALQKAFKQYDSQREVVIKKTRDVLKLSKQVIYAVHRDDNCVKLLASLEKERKHLDVLVKKHKGLQFEGSYKVALQEYVEALLYFNYVKLGKLIDIKVTPEHYVLGLCDLPGELVRRAVYMAGKGKVEEVIRIRDIVDEIYGELLKFDFRQNEIRRKVDGIKYELRKLEDVVLQLQLRGK